MSNESVFEPDEPHPDEWPDDATTADLPDEYPEPHAWHDEDGKPYDSNWRRYNPFQGSVTPHPDRCSVMLTNSMERYGEPRYCMRLPMSEFDVPDEKKSQFCSVHRNHETMIKTAREAFDMGIHSQTIRHTIDKLPPWMKVAVAAWYDTYLGMSVKDFAPTYEDYTVDFSDVDDRAELPTPLLGELTDENQLHIGVPVPTNEEMSAFALFRAAVMDAKTTMADRELLAHGLVIDSVVDIDPETGETMTEPAEHDLNLTVSRLDKDKKELLEFGGVPIDGGDQGPDVAVESPEELIVDLNEVSELDANDEAYMESERMPVTDEMAEFESPAETDR